MRPGYGSLRRSCAAGKWSVSLILTDPLVLLHKRCPSGHPSCGQLVKDVAHETRLAARFSGRPEPCRVTPPSNVRAREESCLPAAQTTSPITEGEDAVFTLTVSPAPSADLTVTVAVTGRATDQMVTIPSGMTAATLDVTTTDDAAAWPNAAITATLRSGTGYTVDVTKCQAVVAVADNDTAPGAPTGLQATPSVSQVALNWNAPADPGTSSIMRYTVEYFTTSTGAMTQDTADDSTTWPVTSLTGGTEHYFRVRAVSAAGISEGSDVVTATPAKPPPPPPSGGGGSGGSSGGSSGTSTSSAPSAPAPPPGPPPCSPIIGSTAAALATELAGDLLVIQRHDQPGVEVEVGVGWISRDGQTLIAIGFVRDGDLGQTYAVVRRFDGGDGRILAYDAGLRQWRPGPDEATFQALGFYWCDVTAADADFFARITLGPSYPASSVPARADYPDCRP